MFGLEHLLRRSIIGEKTLLILLAGLTFLSLINAVPVNVNDTIIGKLVEIKIFYNNIIILKS